MKRHHFIAAILGLSIATSGFAAAPARADNDTAKVIAGIATLAIIGSAIAKSNNDHEYDGVTLHKAGYKTYGGHHYKRNITRKIRTISAIRNTTATSHTKRGMAIALIKSTVTTKRATAAIAVNISNPPMPIDQGIQVRATVRAPDN